MIRDVLLGIEEEGVPFQVCTDENHSAIDLSYQACLASPLGLELALMIMRMLVFIMSA